MSNAAVRLVGREVELARLRSLLNEVVSDGSRLMLIGGDAGAGKTSLVQAFVGEVEAGTDAESDSASDSESETVAVVRGQCVALGGDGLPYAPIVGALRGLLARFGSDQVLEWAGAGRAGLGVLLPDLIAPPAEHPSLRLQLFEAVVRVIENASQVGPVIMVVEDLHWADESTRHLLRFLARALPEAPVLIVITVRTDEITRRHPLRPFLAEIGRLPGVVRLELAGLDRDQVAELLTTLLDQPPTTAVIDLVHLRSEGLPYFVAELVESASQGGVELPETLRDALSVRIQGVSETAQRVLQVAAIGGYRVAHALLEEVDDGHPDEFEAGLREAVDAGLLVIDEDGYAFRHALLREVLHDDVLPGRHARLHARFAAALEARPDLVPVGTAAVEIAHHWSAAHDVDRAFAWAWRAAEESGTAHLEALKLYERALDLWDRVGDPTAVVGSHVDLLVRAVGTARLAGESERALELNRQALSEIPAADVEARIKRLVVQGKTLSFLMRPGGVESLERAVSMLPPDAEPELRSRVLEALATLAMITGADAEPAAREAIEVAAAAGLRRLEAEGWNTLGSHLVNTGQEAAGLAALQRCGEMVATGSRSALRFQVNYSDALNNAGRYREAADLALAGIEAAAEFGFERSTGAMLAGNAAEPLLAVGDWPRAAQLIRRALQLGPPITHLIHLRIQDAWLRLWRGHPEEAGDILAELRGLARGPLVIPQYAGLSLRVEAEQALAVGEPDRAWRCTQDFLDRWGAGQPALLYPLLVAGAAAARAGDQADPAGRRVRRVREVLAAAPVMTITGQLLPVIEAELSDTAQDWRTAWESLDALGAPAHLRPYAGLRLVEHLIENRDRGAAEVATAAYERAVELGAGLVTDRMTSLAVRAGLSLGPRSGAVEPAPASPLAGLTPRERDVLRLVADGCSNGEIGRQLFISTKTASVHVSNILGKLGVASRGEAAAVAHRAEPAEALIRTSRSDR